jgi:hypothetical protein
VDAIFPVAAFVSVLIATRRSLGLGFVAVFAAGYLNGVIRANYLGVATTFMFDAAVFGLYCGFLLSAPVGGVAGLWRGTAGRFALFLMAWPALLSLVPVNDFLVQLVALRATIWFLPVMLIATRLTGADLNVMARGLSVLNLCALAGGIYVYQNGVAALYPENAVTQIIYLSKDVGGGLEYHRIPSTFLSAHAYGGTMVLSLPFVLARLFVPRVGWPDRALAAAGAAAAVAGLLMCAARQPVVTFGATAVLAWVCTRFHPTFGLVAAGVVGAGLMAAASNERLQRAASLEDTEAVYDRVRGSANESFVELLTAYPGGAGMGSSVGTSIPFFLADRAPVAIGLENEYCRILIDQGWIGLGAWLLFLWWLLHRPPPLLLNARWGLGVILMYALVVTMWATTFIGAGLLASIPGAVMLLTQMGVLLRVRSPECNPSPPSRAPSARTAGPTRTRRERP